MGPVHYQGRNTSPAALFSRRAIFAEEQQFHSVPLRRQGRGCVQHETSDPDGFGLCRANDVQYGGPHDPPPIILRRRVRRAKSDRKRIIGLQP
jgi:hypothetical protein